MSCLVCTPLRVFLRVEYVSSGVDNQPLSAPLLSLDIVLKFQLGVSHSVSIRRENLIQRVGVMGIEKLGGWSQKKDTNTDQSNCKKHISLWGVG